VTGIAIDVRREAPENIFNFAKNPEGDSRFSEQMSRYNEIGLKCCACYCHWHCQYQKWGTVGLVVPAGEKVGRDKSTSNPYGSCAYVKQT
jgi:hypothetical protein